MNRQLIPLPSVLLPILFLFAFATGRAQDKIIHLKPHLQRSIHWFGYNKIIVLDNRFDTAKICLSNQGYPVKFDRQTADCIAGYIRNSTRPVAKGVGALLLNIKKMHCSLEKFGDVVGAYMIFDADAYVKNNDGSYGKLISLELQSGYNEASAATTVGHLLDLAIRMIDTAHRHTCESYSLDCIDTRVNADWAAYPILHDKSRTPSGYFTSFSGFRDHSITPFPIRMALHPDSTYQVVAPPGPDPETGKTIGPFWAVADSNGILYIQLENNIFLPLHLHDNAVTFLIPRSLSDKHVVQLIKLQMPPSTNAGIENWGAGWETPGNLSSDAGAGALLFVGMFAMVYGTYSIVTGVTNHSRIKGRDTKVKKYTASRDAVLLMDTGEVVYY